MHGPSGVCCLRMHMTDPCMHCVNWEAFAVYDLILGISSLKTTVGTIRQLLLYDIYC